jgi:hypothetical protein
MFLRSPGSRDLAFSGVDAFTLVERGGNELRRQFGRRSDYTACDSDCPWFSQFLACTTQGCECAVINDANLGVITCADCIRPINSTFATLIDEAAEFCANGTFSSTPTTSSSTTCSSQCSLYNQAVANTACTLDECFCPTVTVGGPPCSICFATINITYANIIGSVISICSSEFPSEFVSTTITPTTTSTPVNPPQSTSTVVVVSPTPNSTSSGLSHGAIGGIVGGLLSSFLVIGGLVFWWTRQKSSGPQTTQSVSPVYVEPTAKSQEPAINQSTSEKDVPSGRLQYPIEYER